MQVDSWRGRNREPETLNKYRYIHAGPVDLFDPSGDTGSPQLIAGISNFALKERVLQGETERLFLRNIQVIPAYHVWNG